MINASSTPEIIHYKLFKTYSIKPIPTTRNGVTHITECICVIHERTPNADAADNNGQITVANTTYTTDRRFSNGCRLTTNNTNSSKNEKPISISSVA
jgi:hypothetical protein